MLRPKRHLPIPIVAIENLTHEYQQGDSVLRVLDCVELTLWRGEVVALVAPSGAGKSTILQLLGLLERPKHGEIIFQGQATQHLTDSERTRVRRNKIGFIYQFHHLLDDFTALENVIIPQLIQRIPYTKSVDRAQELLTVLGLGHRLHHVPQALSGGEQQRVSIARAIITLPNLLLADEPTGNLDPKTAREVFNLFVNVARHSQLTVLIATHNTELAELSDRVVTLRDGKIYSMTQHRGNLSR